ncbi:hypothetical protein R6Q57_024452 [Mikania cordata]
MTTDAGNGRFPSALRYRPGVFVHLRVPSTTVDEDEAVLTEWWPVIGDVPFVNKARLVLEFLSTFEFHPPQAGGLVDLDQLPAISFILCGQEVRLSLTQWGIAIGFYTRDEVTTPLFLDAAVYEDEAVFTKWGSAIADARFVNKARVSRIHYPLHRYLHRCIACTITGRHLNQE